MLAFLKDYKEYLLLGINVIISVAVSIITTKLTYSREIKRIVYEERQKVYIDMHYSLNQLTIAPYLKYDEEYVEQLKKINTRITIYASNKVIKILRPFVSKLIEDWERYLHFIDNCQKEISNNEFENVIEMKIENDIENFKNNNLFEVEKINSLFDKVTEIFRKELRVNTLL